MPLVEFTPQAEKGLINLLTESKRTENTLLVVDATDHGAQLSLKDPQDLDQLQRDVDTVGPFRVPIGDLEMSLFVRERQARVGDFYEIDYLRGNEARFEIRTRS